MERQSSPGLNEGRSQRLSSERLRRGLSVPLIIAPMFVVSTPALILEGMRAGVIGAIPALNARSPGELETMLRDFNSASAQNDQTVPYAVNIITHHTNDRFHDDMHVIERQQAPIVITSVGSPDRVVRHVHSYGGLVLADVASIRHAQKAVNADVDGLILLCGGAGGQTGRLNPFAFIAAVREFFGGLLIVAGSITNGRQLAALQVAGADMGYVGTSFIAAREANADAAYRQALATFNADDVIETDMITGALCNILPPTAKARNITPTTRFRLQTGPYDATAIKWSKDLMTAGHGVGAVKATRTCAEIVRAFKQEYEASCDCASTSR